MTLKLFAGFKSKQIQWVANVFEQSFWLPLWLPLLIFKSSIMDQKNCPPPAFWIDCHLQTARFWRLKRLVSLRMFDWAETSSGCAPSKQVNIAQGFLGGHPKAQPRYRPEVFLSRYVPVWQIHRKPFCICRAGLFITPSPFHISRYFRANVRLWGIIAELLVSRSMRLLARRLPWAMVELCGSIKPQFLRNLMSYIPKRTPYFLSRPGRQIPLVFRDTCTRSERHANSTRRRILCCTPVPYALSPCLHAPFLMPTLTRVLTAPNAGSESSIQRCDRLPWKLPSRPLPRWWRVRPLPQSIS